jgi:hypothetical protein
MSKMGGDVEDVQGVTSDSTESGRAGDGGGRGASGVTTVTDKIVPMLVSFRKSCLYQQKFPINKYSDRQNYSNVGQFWKKLLISAELTYQ